jgi:sec-independent protein translocase protein TatA
VIGDILQPTHLLFILVIALLVLGPKRLPEVGRSLGRGLRDFRHAMSGEDHHEEVLTQSTAEEEPAKPASEPAEPASEPAEHAGAGATHQP